VSSSGPLFDAGLQIERTTLAWRRTALSVAVGSLIVMRLLPELLGSAWWATAGFIGIAMAGVMWATAARRHTQFYIMDRPAARGGGALLGVTVLCVLAGMAAFASWAIIVVRLRTH